MKSARPANYETSADVAFGILPPSQRRAKFPGTRNPRDLRVIQALRVRPIRREDIDRVAGCSNGPDLVARLRRLGLEIPCSRVPAFDRDGQEVMVGVYEFTARDKRMIETWLRERTV